MHSSVFTAIQDDLKHVSTLISDALRTDEPRVVELLDDIGEFHGKMLRPAMLLQFARTLGDVTDDHRKLAAAIEMIHTATLIHDDMIDDGDMRRGQPTAHVRYGNSAAVLLGDYFYTHAFHLVASIQRPELSHQLTAVTNIVCQGELHQMCARRDLALEESEYNRIIYAKTAALTEISCAFGLINGAPEQQQAAAEYGRKCGMAFQIVDDCLDLSGNPEKVGKTLSTDIECGRLTLPFIHLLKLQQNEADKQRIGKQLLQVQNEQDVQAVREQVLSGGGVESAMSTARTYVAEAQQAIQVLPDTTIRQELLELAAFIVARDF